MILLVSQVSRAAEPLRIAVNHIEGMLEEHNNEAPYTEILTHLQQGTSGSVSYFYYPGSRASKAFNEHEVDCLFPSSLGVHNEKSRLIESLAFNTAKAYFIGYEEYRTESLLLPRQRPVMIAYRRGNTFGGRIEELVHQALVEVNSDSQAKLLLDKGRVDVMLVYLPDAMHLINQQKTPALIYTDASHFYSQNDSMLCHDSQGASRFITTINERLAKMQDSGALKRILSKAYIQP
ncbi:transporter substrate-binding domain-containing protein [Lacimicrobium sp. SS2-24]|uniref:transporter substrate-binding domain-containing protein n=1 Tax=Lacimicrobium sp. SS2-24 TaxID=2005569 RepID=UPI001439DB21|nr:transporter substrate-binding domain-containing protein [Lacimicrobium sp. SS2-24]